MPRTPGMRCVYGTGTPVIVPVSALELVGCVWNARDLSWAGSGEPTYGGDGHAICRQRNRNSPNITRVEHLGSPVAIGLGHRLDPRFMISADHDPPRRAPRSQPRCVRLQTPMMRSHQNIARPPRRLQQPIEALFFHVAGQDDSPPGVFHRKNQAQGIVVPAGGTSRRVKHFNHRLAHPEADRRQPGPERESAARRSHLEEIEWSPSLPQGRPAAPTWPSPRTAASVPARH